MKKIVLSVFLVALVGCSILQHKNTYNTLYSVEATTTAAVDGYFSLVAKGTLPTNGVPSVSTKYNLFQASFLLAIDAAQFNSNAIAPQALTVESQDLLNLITTIKNGGK